MSGRGKNNIPLTQNGVITEEAMIAYLNGMLSPDDTVKFEQLIADDPFAREALEGLQSLPVIQLKENLKEVHQSISSKTGDTGTSSSIPITLIARYSIAAAVIGLLIGLGFLINYFVSNQTSSLALQSEEQHALSEESTATPLMDYTQINPDSILTTAATIDTVQQTLLPTTDSNANLKAETLLDEQKAIDLINKQKEEEKKKAALPAKEKAEKVKSVSLPNNNTAGNSAPAIVTPSNNTAVTATEQPAAAALKSTSSGDAIASDSKGDGMDAAMQSFNSRDYKSASKQFNKILDKDPENTDAIYFGAVSEYINGNTNKALKGFQKLLDDSNKHNEGAKFYKSQILLKKGKKEEAVKLLEEVSKTSGAFKQRAIEKLSEIK